MPLAVDLTAGTLLHAMQPDALTGRDTTIRPGITFASPDHPLCCRQAGRFASGKVTVYPSLANAGPLIFLALVNAGRLTLSKGTDRQGHQHHQNSQTLFHSLFYPFDLLQGNKFNPPRKNQMTCAGMRTRKVLP